MRQPEDFLSPHFYLHGANLCQWNNTKSHVRLQTADTSNAIARLQRIKSELLRDKGIELSEYRKKVSRKNIFTGLGEKKASLAPI